MVAADPSASESCDVDFGMSYGAVHHFRIRRY
jgi:hypothetical protein